MGRRIDHGLVARKVGLRRQNVHGLGAGDARHQFHGKGGDAGLGDGLEAGLVAIGLEAAHEDGTVLHRLQKLCRGPADGQDDIGVLARLLDDLRTRCGKGIVGNAGARAGTRLNVDLKALLHIGLDRVGAGRDAALPSMAFGGDRNFHGVPLTAQETATAVTRPKITSSPPESSQLAAGAGIDEHGQDPEDQAAEAEQHVAGWREGEGNQRHQDEEADDGQGDRALDEAVISTLMVRKAMGLRTGRTVIGHECPPRDRCPLTCF